MQPGLGDLREATLDHWRAVSILAVLASHLLPLGPKSLQLNHTAGAFGMALFFTLSGYLITRTLLADPSVPRFALRRAARILPLAWLYIVAVTLLEPDRVDLSATLANLFFVANWPPMQLLALGGHLWSLCVEMQFYVAIAVVVFLFPNAWRLLVPLACLGITGLRVVDSVHLAINTYYRVDEILVGAFLALANTGRLGAAPTRLPTLGKVGLLAALLVSCHPESGAINYLRPYFAALLVASTLGPSSDRPENRLMAKPVKQALVYIAAISYALYIIHPLLAHSWLGSGDVYEKYLKRPALFVALFALAHLSTFHFEKHFTDAGKRLARRLRDREDQSPVAAQARVTGGASK